MAPIVTVPPVLFHGTPTPVIDAVLDGPDYLSEAAAELQSYPNDDATNEVLAARFAAAEAIELFREGLLRPGIKLAENFPSGMPLQNFTAFVRALPTAHYAMGRAVVRSAVRQKRGGIRIFDPTHAKRVDFKPPAYSELVHTATVAPSFLGLLDIAASKTLTTEQREDAFRSALPLSRQLALGPQMLHDWAEWQTAITSNPHMAALFAWQYGTSLTLSTPRGPKNLLTPDQPGVTNAALNRPDLSLHDKDLLWRRLLDNLFGFAWVTARIQRFLDSAFSL